MAALGLAARSVGEGRDLGQCLLEVMANLSLFQGNEADHHHVIAALLLSADPGGSPRKA